MSIQKPAHVFDRDREWAGHVARLRRARDLLAVKGFDTATSTLACYSGAGFDDELRAVARGDERVLLVDLPMLYS